MVDHGCSPFYIFLITAFLSPSQNTAPETGPVPDHIADTCITALCFLVFSVFFVSNDNIMEKYFQ